MSCTENESGPFVVFFLPAVVGCLTILLARRWAYAQVSSSSSTAVSRRRKIIKDPLVKRPLPQITKMLPPGAKKSSGISKKGTLPAPEEDVNTNGKRLGRPRLSPTPVNGQVSDVKLPEGPSPPKHIPYPSIPHDGTLLFEAMTFMFTLVATGLQFLNLYRTVWWLPHSNNNQAMNFYLIDPHLVSFIVTLLVRRLLLQLMMAVVRVTLAPVLLPHATIAARMFILGMVLGSLAWCTYFIALKYTLVKIFFLCYPAVIYVVLFGLQPAAFLELDNSETPLLHCCSHDPEQIRAEVEILRQDFNLRVKKVIFNAVVGAYYSSFIPCCFAQPFLYYDVYMCSQQTALVCGALLGRYAAQLLPRAAHVAHQAARHLGRWSPGPNTLSETLPPVWSGQRLWARGATVLGPRGAATCVTASAAAAPGDPAHRRFHVVFSNPSTLLCLLLCMQLSLIVLQLCLLFSKASWHNFLAIVILLFINYYSLFKLMRDYLVAWKVYKAENMIQDKNGSVPVAN